jgi:hypothetical protein
MILCLEAGTKDVSHHAGRAARGDSRVRHAQRRLSVPFCIAFLAATAGQAALAQPSDRWTADEAVASAALPAPDAGGVLASATLSCAEQRWSLQLDFGDGAAPAADTAMMAIGSRAFDLETRLDGSVLTAKVPRQAMGPLQNGSRLEISFGSEQDEPPASLMFSLRGSKVAISSAQERCSLRDMSAYQPVTFTPYSSYINLARELRSADIAAFAQATASQPKLDAAMVELDEGRRVLFTRLCGSSWYYGLSGCNITGFVPEPAASSGDDAGVGDAGNEAAWRAVYDTENVLVHVDLKSLSHGWPDVVTLPTRAQGAGLVWRWDGKSYALKGELPENADDYDPQALRQGSD